MMIPVVYLIHFSAPLGNPGNARAQAQHYLGYTIDLDARIAQHRAGQGAALTRAAVERGITFEVAATWPGDWHLEKHLKALKATPRLCPICGCRHPRGRLHVTITWEQRELDLLDPFAIPMPMPARIDWFEISHYRRWSRPQSYATISDPNDSIPF